MGRRQHRQLNAGSHPQATSLTLAFLTLGLTTFPTWSDTTVATPAKTTGTVSSATVGLSEIYTDNLTLLSKDKQHDFVTLLEPGLTFERSSSRVKFNLNYLLQFLYFTQANDSTQLFHHVTSGLNLEAIQDTLFLDTRVDYDQVLKNPKNAVSYTNIPVTGNRTNAFTAQTGPIWRQTILGQEVAAKATFGVINYDAKGIQNVNFQNWAFDVKTPAKDQGLTAALHHEYLRYNYEISQSTQRQTLTGTLTYNLGGGFAVAGTVGRESDYFDPTSAALTTTIWNAGFTDTSAKTDYSLFIGHRSFGMTVDALFRWKLDAGRIALTYRDSPQNTEELLQQRSATGNIAATPSLPNALTPGTGSVFRYQRADATFSKSFSRNSISLSSFWNKQSNIIAPGQSNLPDVTEFGGGVSWQYRVGGRTDLNLNTDVYQRDFGKSQRDLLIRARAELDYQLGRLTTARFWIAHNEEQDIGGTPLGNANDENQVGIGITRKIF